MPVFMLRDSDGWESIEADTLEEAKKAAKGWARGGHEPRDRTYWITVRIFSWDGAPIDLVKVPIEPVEPECIDPGGHSWADQGVRGHGGGIISVHQCRGCGCRWTLDTWATDPATGEQGLHSTQYEEV